MSPKPRHHGRDHLPGGEDPIPNWPSGGTPSVATFYFGVDNGDSPVSIPAGGLVSTGIPFANAQLPSDGTITGPFIGSTLVQFNQPCMTIEWLYTLWDDAGYNKLAALGTNDRIGFNDVFALANAGAGVHGATYNFGDSTLYVRPNAHIANDTIQAYAYNGDSVSHDINAAILTVFCWSAPGYTGGIPGYPV